MVTSENSENPVSESIMTQKVKMENEGIRSKKRRSG